MGLIPSRGGRLVEADKEVLMVPLMLSPTDGKTMTVSELGVRIRLPWSTIQKDYISKESIVDGYPLPIYSHKAGGSWYILGDDDDTQTSAWWNMD